MSTSAERPRQVGGEDLIPLEQLIRRTPGADQFLALVTESRHADLA